MRHDKEEREILAQLRAQGWRTERTSSGHHKCYPPGGGQQVLFALGGKGSGFHNALARLRRSGFVLGLYEPVEFGAQEASDAALLNATSIVGQAQGWGAPTNALPSLLVSAVKKPCTVCGAPELVKGECCKPPEGTTFGEALRFLREEDEVQPSDLADIIGAEPGRIDMLERDAVLPTDDETAALVELFPRLKLAPAPSVVAEANEPKLEVEADEAHHPDSQEAADELAAAIRDSVREEIVAAPVAAAADPIEELWALLTIVGDHVVDISASRTGGANGVKTRWRVVVQRRDPTPSRVGDGASVRNACAAIAREVTSLAEAAQREAEEKARKAADDAARLRAFTQRIAS